MKRLKLSGMTLVELLVSLGIIGLLTAVALPIFSTFQRRNILRLDAKNLEQIFYYSRTLNNNPSYSSRNLGAGYKDGAGNEKRYGIKITRGDNRATLYPIGADGNIDTGNAVESWKFDSRETLKITAGNTEVAGDLVIFISGDLPNETVSCDIAELDCSQIVKIEITMPRVATIRTISVRGTKPDIGQKFNIIAE